MITGKRAQLLSETKVLTEYGDILRLVLLTCFPVCLFELFFSGSSFSQATVFLQGLRPNFIKENFHECLNFYSLGTLRSLDCSTF